MANLLTVRPTYGALVALALTSMISATGCGDDKEYCGYQNVDGRAQYVCKDDDGDVQGNTVPAPAGTCVVETVKVLSDGTIEFGCMGGGKVTAPPGSGAPGQDGTNGSDGSDGVGCEVVDNGEYCTMTCDNSSTTFWCGDAPPSGSGGSGGSGGGSTSPTGNMACTWYGPSGSDLGPYADAFYYGTAEAWNCEDMSLQESVARNPGVVMDHSYSKESIKLTGNGSCAVASDWGTTPFSVNGTEYVDVDSSKFAIVCTGSITFTTIPFGAS